MDSHEIDFPFSETDTIEDVIRRISQVSYLASISGDKATWIVEVNSSPLAVIAQQWTEPYFLPSSNGKMASDFDENILFFKYWCQVDPELVYECLRDGRPLPDRYGR